eukprot:TRINITY_DN1082_c0_g1_i1.p1 TRINITY_DN1082_c0_g1~~TRINITY_DN1082_c0_g1_i1.p1  ORF type:complete len:1972 (+),score=575.66 TRINITY_DN1082_c0_g1_i1:494-5917(+)
MFYMRVKSLEECNAWVKLIKIQVYKLLDTPIDEIKQIRNEDFWTKKFPWFEDFDSYVNSLPKLRRRIVTNRMERRIERRASTAFRTALQQRIKDEVMQLRDIIKSISDDHILFDLSRQLNQLVKQLPSEVSKQISELIPKLKIPHLLIGSSENSSSSGGKVMLDLAVAKPIEDLIDEIKSIKLNDSERQVVGPTLISLCQYYSDICEQLNTFGVKILSNPPVIIQGGASFINKRILNPSAAHAILRDSRDNKYGLHAVIAYNSVHWKKSPGSPGYEYAVDCLNKLISGFGSAPARVLKITRYVDMKPESFLFLASKTIDGVLLKQVLEEKPHLMSHLNEEAFTLMFLQSLISDLQDGKPDNFIVKFNESSKQVEIVGIDNDHAFADSICKFKDGHTLNIRNIIYFLPHMCRPIDTSARAKFLVHSPFELVMTWLQHLHTQNMEFETLREEGVLTNLDMKEMNLPITLRHAQATIIYRKMLILKRALKQDDYAITHNDLLKLLQPEVFAICNTMFNTTKPSNNVPDQGHTAFRRLFKLPIIENDPDLSKILDKCMTVKGAKESMTLRDLINKGPKPDTHHYTSSRDMDPIASMSELISQVDFSKDASNQEFLYQSIIPSISFTGVLSLTKATKFGEAQFKQLLERSPKLTTLQLIQCDEFHPDAVRRNLKPNDKSFELVISDCKNFTTTALYNLHNDGYNVTIKVKKLKEIREYNVDDYSIPIILKEFVPPQSILSIDAQMRQNQFDKIMESVNSLPASEFLEHKNYLKERATTYDLLHNVIINKADVKKVKGLIDMFDLNVNSWSLNCDTPLQVAARIGNKEICQLLFEKGADINLVGSNKLIPFQEALLSKQQEIASYFLENYDVNLKVVADIDGDSFNLLHLSTIMDMLDISKRLIVDEKMDVNSVTKKGRNLLHLCGEYNIRNTEFISFLFENGIDCNKLDDMKNSPFLSVGKGGNIVLARMLLKQLEEGDDMEIVSPLSDDDDDNENQNKNRESISKKHGLALNKEQQNVLHLATKYLITESNSDVECDENTNCIKFFKDMIELFPDLVEMKDFLKRSPLCCSSIYGNYVAMKALLESGAKIDAVDNSGNTVIHHVVELDDEPSAINCLKLLLKHERIQQSNYLKNSLPKKLQSSSGSVHSTSSLDDIPFDGVESKKPSSPDIMLSDMSDPVSRKSLDSLSANPIKSNKNSLLFSRSHRSSSNTSRKKKRSTNLSTNSFDDDSVSHKHMRRKSSSNSSRSSLRKTFIHTSDNSSKSSQSVESEGEDGEVSVKHRKSPDLSTATALKKKKTVKSNIFLPSQFSKSQSGSKFTDSSQDESSSVSSSSSSSFSSLVMNTSNRSSSHTSDSINYISNEDISPLPSIPSSPRSVSPSSRSPSLSLSLSLNSFSPLPSPSPNSSPAPSPTSSHSTSSASPQPSPNSNKKPPPSPVLSKVSTHSISSPIIATSKPSKTNQSVAPSTSPLPKKSSSASSSPKTNIPTSSSPKVSPSSPPTSSSPLSSLSNKLSSSPKSTSPLSSSPSSRLKISFTKSKEKSKKQQQLQNNNVVDTSDMISELISSNYSEDSSKEETERDDKTKKSNGTSSSSKVKNSSSTNTTDIGDKNPLSIPERVSCLSKYNSSGVTPLGRAVLLLYRNAQLRTKIIETLVQSGSSFDTCLNPNLKSTIIHQAVRRGAIEPVKYLLESSTVPVVQIDSHFHTPLHEACRKGLLEIVSLVCQASVREIPNKEMRLKFINQKTLDSDTALILAIKGPKSHYEIVSELIKYGASVVAENNKGETPLDVAQRRNLKKVVELIKEEVSKSRSTV